jgi:nucleotide-binding universal stress UspA family protein
MIKSRPQRREPKFRRILIAVDSGPIAAHAADTGVSLARELGGEVALVHAIDIAPAYGTEAGVSQDQLMAEARREGKRLLVGFREQLSLESSTLEFIVEGTPSEEIVKAARQWPADVIVIGTRGLGSVQRALLGSVAEGVMRHAPCPVLVIRATE